MRITYLHQYFRTPAMSGITRSYEIARRLASSGHTVRMVTADTDATSPAGCWRVENIDGIEVHWLSLPYNNYMNYRQRITAFLRFAFASARRAAGLSADIVFATSTPLTIAIPGMFASKWLRVPMVFEVRDMWPDVPIAMGALKNPVLRRVAKWLEMAAYRMAAHIIALAPGMRADIIAKGVAAEKISVIPNGCDFDLFSGTAENKRAVHTWLGSRPMVLYPGILGQATGVGYLTEVARHALTIDPDICFVVIGDGAEEPLIRAQAEENGLLGKNFFMLGEMPKCSVVPWVMACDAMIALFTGPRVMWKDAVQNKFFDALAAGKPIINNHDGWVSQIAVETGAGIAIDRDNPRAAAEVLCRYMRDTAGLKRAGAAALELGKSRFARDQQVAEFEKILVRVAELEGAPDPQN